MQLVEPGSIPLYWTVWVEVESASGTVVVVAKRMDTVRNISWLLWSPDSRPPAAIITQPARERSLSSQRSTLHSLEQRAATTACRAISINFYSQIYSQYFTVIPPQRLDIV